MNPQIAIDLKAAWPFVWTALSGVFGWFLLRLTRQFDGHSEAISELEKAAHADRLHAAQTFAAKDDLKTIREEIRKDFDKLDKKLDDRFDAMIRELRK